MKKLLPIIITILMIVTTISFSVAAQGNTVILYTNDVHCAIDDYAVLAAYRADLISDGNTVITVDVGDAIQGEVIGTLTDGSAIVDIMNAVGYDYAVPGNHEFDYGMDTFLDIAQTKSDYEYLSSNFYDLSSLSGVLDAYAIEEVNGKKIAFIGISTPETVSKANPEFFKDENGNFIYGFPTYDMQDGVLYENIQKSIDKVEEEGADIVIALGHMGILETTDGWKSTDVITNTDGIDYFLDAHSHQTIEAEAYENKNGEKVILSSTGTKFNNFGVMTISGGGEASFELVDPDSVDIDAMSFDAKAAYNTVKAKIDGYNAELEYLFEEIGTTEVNMETMDENGAWLVRRQETNLGDFVADAYRAITGADVAFANGGGVRSEIGAGPVTRQMLMNVNPWSNAMCVIEVTGQQLIDALEFGARSCPEPLGGFFQVSGLTYEIHTWRESPVITDALGNFRSIDASKERRVTNILVNGEAVDTDKKYTVTGSQYLLLDGGDGLTMFKGATVIEKDGLLCDSEMLIKYFTENLGGKITKEKYGNPNGDGRIKIIRNNPDAYPFDYEISYGETLTVHTGNYDSDEYTYIRFIPEADGSFVFKSSSDENTDPLCMLYDANMQELEFNDDNPDSDNWDFLLKYDFVANEAYYFAVATHSQEAETEVSLVCGHSYKNGICTVCSEKCSHEKSFEKVCYCECGEVFFGEDIYLNGEVEYISAEHGEAPAYFRFTPNMDGLYAFISFADSGEPACNLYNSELDHLKSANDNDGNFLLAYELSKGETYYFEVFDIYEEAVYTAKLTLAVHTAEDGTEHTLEVVEETFSTCVDHGYTIGLYCGECDEYAIGHIEKELADYHWDDNDDKYCDDCGAEIICEDHYDDDEDGYCDYCEAEIDKNEDSGEGNETDEDCGLLCRIFRFFRDIYDRMVSLFGSLFNIFLPG